MTNEPPSRPEWRASWDTSSRPSIRRSPLVMALLVTATALTGVAVSLVIYIVPSRGSNSLSIIFQGFATTAAVAIAATVVPLVNRRSSVTSVRVAILGMPQVGKTTLIAACFQEIFSRRVNIRAIMSGTRSFESLNENISRLAVGLPIRPTTDQDVTAYRFEIEPSGLLSPRYRVEFGDFPGEDTKKYIEQYGPWLHNSPFFEWALTCDAFVFCVDSGPLAKLFKVQREIEGMQQSELLRFGDDDSPARTLSRSMMRDRAQKELPAATEYVNDSSAAVRAAWQHIVASFGPRRMAYLRKSPVLLVFTKIDLLFREPDVEDNPNTIRLDSSKGTTAQRWLEDQFKDLTNYLADETNQFSIVSTSSFATIHGSRVGMYDFLRGILPRRAFTPSSNTRMIVHLSK